MSSRSTCPHRALAISEAIRAQVQAPVLGERNLPGRMAGTGVPSSRRDWITAIFNGNFQDTLSPCRFHLTGSSAEPWVRALLKRLDTICPIRG